MSDMDFLRLVLIIENKSIDVLYGISYTLNFML